MEKVKKANAGRKKVMTFWSFFLLAMAGPLLMRVVNNTVKLGYVTIPLYILDILVYVIPYLFITIEFVSIKKIQGNESGYNAWITCAAGRKMGYLASWAYFFVNLFYFLSLVPDLISFLIVTITGDTNIMKKIIPDPRNQQLIITLLSLLIFWLATFISMRGTNILGKIAKVAGIGRMFIAFLFIILGFFITFLFINKGVAKTPFDSNNFVGKVWVNGQAQSQDTWSLIGGMSWIIFAVGGQEVMATYINDTKNGVKTFIKSAILTCSVTVCVFIFGTLVIGLITNRQYMYENGLSSGILYAVKQLFPGSSVWALISVRIVGIFLCVGTICTLLLWISAPAKIFFSEIPEGIMGKWIAKTDKMGVPFNALMAQGIIVSILFLGSLLPVYFSGAQNAQSALNQYLLVLNGVTAATSELPMIMLFIAYIYFRINRDDTERKYRFFKNKWLAVASTSLMLSVFLIATFTTVVPSPTSWKNDFSNSLLTLILGLGGMVFFMGFAWVMWEIYEFRIIHGKIFDEQSLIKYWYENENIRKNKINNKNKKRYIMSKKIKKLEKYRSLWSEQIKNND